MSKLPAQWVLPLLKWDFSFVPTSKERLMLFNHNPLQIHGRYMDLPQHTDGQAAIKTVGFSERIGAEEDQGRSISQ